MIKLPDYDIVIAGGGMIGASLACALCCENIRIAVIEAVSYYVPDQPSYDDRGLALSLSTVQILKALKLWGKVSQSANPIQHIHVSDRHHFGFVRLNAEMLDIPVLGYVVIARELGRALINCLVKAGNVDLFCPAVVDDINIKQEYAEIIIKDDKGLKSIKSKLLVAADGTNSAVREMLGIKTHVMDYEQTAIVTNITPAKSHNNTAYERFTESGPLALLPLAGERCAVVFTVDRKDQDYYLHMDDEEFTKAVQHRFGRRLGKFYSVGIRKSYPILQLEIEEHVRQRVVVLGNSAHTLHPNGAQGFNLGLRDVAGLAEVLIPAIKGNKDPGQKKLLDDYITLRKKDQKCVTQFSNGLASLFYNNLPHKVLARNIGMIFIDMIPALKNSFMRRTMGLHGKQPAMVRGLAL